MFTDTHSAPQAPNQDSLWDSSFVAQNYFCWGGGKKEGARDRKGISHCDEERTTQFQQQPQAEGTGNSKWNGR